MSGHYDMEGNPISLMEWAELFEDMDGRRVAQDQIGHYKISTVWLGLDHNWSKVGPPLIFETMAFDMSIEGLNETSEIARRVGMKVPPPDEQLGEEVIQLRYATRKEAEEGHASVIKMAEAGVLDTEVAERRAARETDT